MEENKDLMVQEEETTNVDLDTYDYDGEATEEEESGGFGVGALLISAVIGAGAAWLGKKGFNRFQRWRQSKKNVVEVINIKDIPNPEDEEVDVDPDEDENEEK